MKVELLDIDTIIPYARNPRKNDKAVIKVAASIKEYGFRQPIVVDGDNVIVVGHTRWKAAKKLGMKQVPVHIADNLTPQQCKAYRIADNRTNEEAEWDMELLGLELEEVGDLFTAFDDDEFDDDDDDEGYTSKIETPIYEPKGEKPDIVELFNDEKTILLVERINASNIDGEIKEFLIKAAQRHNVFNYQNIAEYYCHAPKEVQELFEESALVIIDFDKAMENGFVEVTDEMVKLFKDTWQEGDKDDE